jgi:hypothetical protein
MFTFSCFCTVNSETMKNSKGLPHDSITFNVEPSTGFGSRTSLPRADDRLKRAITRLRRECFPRMNSDECERLSDAPSEKMHAGMKTMLLNSRAREADLQDEIDTLKCRISDSEYRVKELESAVDEWRDRYITEREKSQQMIQHNTSPTCTRNDGSSVNDRAEASSQTSEIWSRDAYSGLRLSSPVHNGIVAARPVYDLDLSSTFIPDISTKLSHARLSNMLFS